jgi:GNAT superfamily N-acetyltransferase
VLGDGCDATAMLDGCDATAVKPLVVTAACSPSFWVVLAEAEGASGPVGFAFVYHSYSTWEGRALYLEDLYVTPAYRRHGIGSLMTRMLAVAAKVAGCARLVWQVLDWYGACAGVHAV